MDFAKEFLAELRRTAASPGRGSSKEVVGHDCWESLGLHTSRRMQRHSASQLLLTHRHYDKYFSCVLSLPCMPAVLQLTWGGRHLWGDWFGWRHQYLRAGIKVTTRQQFWLHPQLPAIYTTLCINDTEAVIPLIAGAGCSFALDWSAMAHWLNDAARAAIVPIDSKPVARVQYANRYLIMD